MVAELLENQSSPSQSFVRNASWCLANMCRGNPRPDSSLTSKCIPTLAKVLINFDDFEIIQDVCWAISYFSDSGGDGCKLLIDSGLIPRLI